LDSTYGYAAQCFKPYQQDGLPIELLKEQGAIPFVRSNLPQGGMTIESVNFIWGRAKNPWDKTRAVGGSSGGEAGLVAARCSPLGIGSDVGGSIRIPALFCGLYGFKPTAGRGTVKGHTELAPSCTGQINIRVAIGPIAKSIKDLNLMMKSLLDETAWAKKGPYDGDVYTNLKPWNEKIVFENKLYRIGVVKTCEFFGACTSNKRAVEEAASILQRKGHTIIELSIDEIIKEAFIIFLQITAAEGDTQFLKDAAKGEKIISEYDLLVLVAGMPNWLQDIVSRILKLAGMKRTAEIMKYSKKLDAYEYLLVSKSHNELQLKFMKIWQDKQLDCLILPGLAEPAIKHGLSKELFMIAIYTMFCNVMNLPCGVLPISTVKEDEQVYTRKDSGNHWDLFSEKMDQNLKDSKGLPVGIQVCSLPFQDEKSLSVMRQIDDEIQFYKNRSFPVCF